MAFRRKERRTERAKLDATPPWERRQRPAIEATKGPFDITDAPQDDLERVDLGALHIPVTDLEVRVDVNEAQEVVSVTLVGEQGHMQLGAFAAPRSEGIWDDVRGEIVASVTEQRGKASEEAHSEFGTALVGRLPVDGAMTPVRFLGVDGPRWMLRAMLVGPCANGDEQAGPFLDVLRGTIVVRGTDPLPVREPIPLRLPSSVAEQLAATADAPAED